MQEHYTGLICPVPYPITNVLLTHILESTTAVTSNTSKVFNCKWLTDSNLCHKNVKKQNRNSMWGRIHVIL